MKNETLQICVSDAIGLSDRIRTGSKEHRTGRSADYYDSQQPAKGPELDELIRKFVETSTSELEEFLLPIVRDFSTQFQPKKKNFYRGLCYSEKANIQCDRIGPSPKPEDNRYSVKGEPCLYLIDNIQFLYEELKTSSLLIQEYDNIAFNNMRIADLSAENASLDNILHLAFQRAESGRTASYKFEEVLRKKGESPYLVSQLLAACFKKQDWDGMYIPVVHGASGKNYHNLSIFASKISNWRDWATRPYYRGGQKECAIGQ
ncbi:MAG: hypothetical protein ACYSUD_17960 [Planctomycetota bacterium]|jgi:hypothetical protein